MEINSRKFKKKIGLIKWFDISKGFGVILDIQGKEYFVHKNGISNFSGEIYEKQAFVFEVEKDKNKNRYIAVNCTRPSTQYDFNLSLLSLGCNRDIYFDKKITKKDFTEKEQTFTKRVKYDFIRIYFNEIFKIQQDRTVLFFETGFSKFFREWSFEKILDYYKLTLNHIYYFKFTSENESAKSKDYNIEKIIHLIESYNLQISDFIHFKIWDSDFYEMYNYALNGKLISDNLHSPTNVNVFLNNLNEFTFYTFKKLLKYDYSFKSNVIDTYFSIANSNVSVIKEKIKIFNLNITESKEVSFNYIVESISEELLFEMWHNKSLFIDYEEKLFGSFTKDFKINKKILFDNINKLNNSSFKRIISLYGEEFFKDILLSYFENRSISKINISTIFTIIKETITDVELKREVVSLFLMKLKDQEIIFLLNQKIISPDENNSLNILEVNINVSPDFILNICNILVADELSFRVLKIIKELNETFFINYILKNASSLSDDLKLKSYNFLYTEFDYLEKIISNWNFEYDSITRDLLNMIRYNNIQINSDFWNRFKNSRCFSIETLKNAILLNKDDDFIKLFIDYLNLKQLKDVDFIINDINNIEDYNILLIEKLIKQGSNLSISNLEEVLIKFKDNNILFIDRAEYIEKLFLILKEQNILKSSIISLIINLFPSYFNSFYKGTIITNDFLLSTLEVINNFKDNLCLESNFNEIINSHILFKVYFKTAEPDSINFLNNFFKDNNYAYQSDFIKFLIFRFYNRKLLFEDFKNILLKLNIIQLNAKIICEFILKSPKSRDETMVLMNFIVKNHLKDVLIDNQFNIKTYSNIFSLENLVNRCNGRKKISNAKFWANGNLARWYISGQPQIRTLGIENIYCEGRFYKKGNFFDSNKNVETDMKYSLYWCKNDYCVQPNCDINFNDKFTKWTLSEINEIFNINLDRLAFTYIAGWLNRIESIFERLVCKSCNFYLTPNHFVPKLLGYYAVPVFSCKSETCIEYGINIRFTHCKGCTSILDSRECKVCVNCNWLICNNSKCRECGCGTRFTPKIPEYNL